MPCRAPPGFRTLSLHDALPIFVGQDGHGVGEGLEDDALLLGVLHFLLAGGQLLHAAAVDDVDRLSAQAQGARSEEHTSELQSRFDLVCRLLLEKKKQTNQDYYI